MIFLTNKADMIETSVGMAILTLAEYVLQSIERQELKRRRRAAGIERILIIPRKIYTNGKIKTVF